MADVLTPAQRRHCMSSIRGRDTRPEVRLRKALWALGLRYRLRSKLPGRPDLVFVADHVAVFVDGCFWHQCPKHAVWPKNNSSFWRRKLEANVKRDRRNNRELKLQGWKVIRIWEHEVNSGPEAAAQKLFPRIRRGGRTRL